jgi:hypothetical protein
MAALNIEAQEMDAGNVTAACQNAFQLVPDTLSAECRIRNPDNPLDSELDSICGKREKCYEEHLSKMKSACSKDLNNQMVTYFFEFELQMVYKSVCAKNNRGQYCKPPSNQAGPQVRLQCSECFKKWNEIAQEVMNTVPADVKELGKKLWVEPNPCTKSGNVVSDASQLLLCSKLLLLLTALSVSFSGLY